MRILFALPGLHRVNRGAEIAFEAIAGALASAGEEVTLIGSGPAMADRPYRYLKAGLVDRERFERFPRMPFLRSETAWEEATFVPGLLRQYRPTDYDVTVTCSFPFTNLALRRAGRSGNRPAHVFVTQNGDWPAQSDKSEYRLFGCDGLVCINPDYFERNKALYRCALIPNGVDLTRFAPGPPEHGRFGLDTGRPIVLMVSALIPSKHVEEGIRAVAAVPDAMLLVAGDGPLRDELDALAAHSLPGRYRRISVAASDMPSLYRTADAFMHLSRDESFGNVFVEALACGTPIVAHDLPRTRWILGDNAHFAGESADLPRQLSRALDDGRRSAAGLQRAAQFGWPAIAAQYREFFEEVVKARASENGIGT